MKELTFQLEDVIYQKLQVWAQSLGLMEEEALKIIIGKEVQGVYLPPLHTVMPTFPGDLKSDGMTKALKMQANVFCSTGAVKCSSCSGKLTADELIDNDGICYNCKPKPVDVDGMFRDVMNQDKKDV